jgi:apolipoprotein N-acyltransferase
MKLWLQKLVAAAGTGCLLFLACADFDIWPLAWIAFLPVLLVTRADRPRRAFLWGWLAGLVANAGGFYWITTLLMRFGHLPFAVALILFLLLCAYQGFHFGVFLWIVRRVREKRPELPLTLLAPVVMTALELVMPFIFPWYLAITQAWVLPVIQVADLAGPLGVSFLLMMVNGLAADLLLGRIEGRPFPKRPLIATALTIALALGYGALRIHQTSATWAAAPKLKVGVVQANIGIIQKGRAGLALEHLALHHRESQRLVAQGAELLVWPESSYPFAIDRERERDFPPEDPRQVMRGIKVPLLFGVLTFSRAEKYPYNSAYMMEPDGRITGRFDKNFLLVFGEYIPFYEKIPSFKKWFPAASHFQHGTEVTVFPFKEHKLGPLICYEDIIAAFGRRLAPLEPNLFVNITNDAWFGRTSEPHEHLALAVYRSVEHRLGMVRAVNTGVTAFIDARGKVYAKTRSYDPVHEPGVPPVTLLAETALMPPPRTVYAAVGDLFGYLNLAGTLVLLVLAWRTGAPGPSLPEGRKQKRKRRHG